MKRSTNSERLAHRATARRRGLALGVAIAWVASGAALASEASPSEVSPSEVSASEVSASEAVSVEAASAEAAKLVADWLAKRKGSLSAPIYTYHYATRERAGLPIEGYVAPQGPHFDRYVRDKVARYFDLSLEARPYAMVSGLYVAVDPVASRSYGGAGNDWMLAQLVLPEGFEYVDIRLHKADEVALDRFPNDLVESLQAAGCSAPDAPALLTMLEDLECRAISVQVMNQLAVDGILYTFRAFDFTLCGDRVDSAFILLDPAAFAADALLVQEASQDTAVAERARIRELFHRAREAGSFRKPPWVDVEPVDAGSEGLDQWMRQYLFDCQIPLEAAVGGGETAASEAPSEGAKAQADGSVDSAAQNPTSALITRARQALDGGDVVVAVEAFEEALALDPEAVEALHDLAWIYAASEDPRVLDPEGAVPLAQKLVALTHYGHRRSTKGAPWSILYKIKASQTLAVANAGAANFSRAREYSQHALELSESWAETLDDPAALAEVEALAEFSRHLVSLVEAESPYRGPMPHTWPVGRPWLTEDAASR